MEYLGFDPSTSCLLSTHASNCANTQFQSLYVWFVFWSTVPIPRTPYIVTNFKQKLTVNTNLFKK